MSEKLGEELDLPMEHPARGSVPTNSAYQCQVCGGIAYNPVCPYCAEDEDA